jgi:hypothetical protein
MQFITGGGEIYDRIEPCETDFTYKHLINRLKNQSDTDINNIRPYELCVSYTPNLIKCNNNQPINLDDEIDWSSDVFITFKIEYWCGVVRKKTNQRFYKKVKPKDDDKKSIKEAFDIVLKKYLSVNPTSIQYMVKQSQEICDWVVNKYPSALEFVNDTYKTQIMCKNATEKDYTTLKFVPSHMQTNEMYDSCIRQDTENFDALKYIPEEKRTIQLYKIALYVSKKNLQNIPFNIHTKELYEESIQENISNTSYIQKELLNDELVSFIISCNPVGMIYTDFDVKYQTEERWIKILDSCSIGPHNNIDYILKKIDKSIFTSSICEIAIEKYYNAFKYIPYEVKTSELCKIAVNKADCALEYVPEEFMTEELCKIAVNAHGHALQYVPEKFITEELCKIAINNYDYAYALKYVPDELKTKELCKIAVNKNGCALIYVPNALKTKELCEIAVSQSGYALEYVPNALKTKELCKIAVRQNGNALKYVPNALQTYELRVL